MSKSRQSKLLRSAKPLNTKLDRNLGTYATVAGMAGVSLLALAQPAEGKVIYTATYHVLNNTYFLDVNHDGHIDFVINSFGGCSEREGYSLCLRFFFFNMRSDQTGNFMAVFLVVQTSNSMF